MPRSNSNAERKGISRPKSRSTVSKKSYRAMQRGWSGAKKKRRSRRTR